MGSAPKKPIYKKKWVWALVAVAAIGAAGSGANNDSDSRHQNEPPPPAQSTSVKSNQENGSQSESTTGLEETAADFLSKQFELDLTDFKESASQFEVTVSVDGVSDRTDQTQAPEDWESIQLRMISAQARMSETLEQPKKETTLYLRDSDNDLMLSVRGGKIIYNKYKQSEEPPDSPDVSEPASSGNGNGSNFNIYDNPSQQQTTATYVLNTNTMKFHLPGCDSVAKIAPENYSTFSGTRDGAISKGYDPCGKCNP